MNDPIHDSPAPLSRRESSNLVTDVIAGPNLRLFDNVVQGIAVVVESISASAAA